MRKAKALVKVWVGENEGEIHALSHLVNENELEAVKVLDGEQDTDGQGRVTLTTLELHFLKDLILIERVVEAQEPGSYTTTSESTQLGYMTPPACGDVCRDPSPKEK